MASNELRKLLKQERQIRSIMDAMKEFRQNYNEIRDKSSLPIRIKKLDDVYELFCEVRMQIELIIEDTDGSEEFVDPDETVDAQARKMAANKHKRDMDNAQILKEFISEYFVLKQSLEDLLCPSMLNPAAGPAPSISQQHSSVSMMRFVEEYLRLGHMREVTEDKESTAQQYYIPHHCVLKPESSSTKLRVVFDASCSTTSGISLNDALMVGPTVQDDLLSIVMRFRLHRFAIVADIEKMYRMVHVQQRDWQFQRIFWRSNPNEFIRIFELKTVTYGTASAPYLATKCLKRLAELDGGTFPDAAKVLAEDFYVDDMMSGVDSIEEGVQLCAEIQRLLSGGGFTLRKWSSNCPAVLERIPEDCKDERTCFELDDSKQLLENQLWWNGPSWLVQDESTWPMADDVPLTNFDTRFLEENTAISVVANMAPPNEIFSLRSSLMDLVKLTAWLLRFIHNTRQRNHSDRRQGALMFAEREAALIQLVKLAQRERFDQDIKELLRKNQVKSSSRLNSLCPRLLDGVIRVGGRLANAQISSGRKHPIILDKDHPLTTLVMLHYHHKMLHAGQQLLIASVRDRFWPIGVCSLARQTIHRCVTCFRNKPTVHEQLMGDLPSERVTPAPPFLRVGVDYCGPFQVVYPNRRAVPVKYYAAIFVCLVTKSVHIETAADLTTAAFLAAFRRFVARRGKPSVVMCDNGCNFVGARRELDELRRVFLAQQSQQTIVSEAADEGIEFKFIPAKSPNFGGLWEAAVKSMKQHLRRAIRTKTLTPDELQTVLVQIEACLNSRPLTPLSNDPGDFEALTPGHFLSQRPLTAIPEPSLQEVPENRLSRWQRTQDFLQRIWRKWSTQYLSDLHNRTKWTRQRNNLFVGTMVLVKEDNLPPLKWALGRVTHVTKGADGNIRVVTVKTKDGSYTRAISKICVLPIRDNDQIGAEGKN
ncbi:uncharacterized protein LOC128739545 [Sabethes cyaneus]|uniref:uncharacterized protein LOC128739545 n=1 Tax=Sabethes cyaneus TaxID=53552 RepID=UPI00237DF839|nr:uncharacterized protein LOC128739545 [Sabethes cyaneus]